MAGILVVLISSLVPILIWYTIWYYGNVRRYPHGPMPIPFFGNVLQLRSQNTHKQLEEIAEKWGPDYTIFIPLPTVVITGLAEMREALLKKGLSLKRPTTPKDSLFMNVPNGGIIFSEGKEWEEQRKFAHATLRQFGMEQNLMEEKIHISIDALFQQFDQSGF